MGVRREMPTGTSEAATNSKARLRVGTVADRESEMKYDCDSGARPERYTASVQLYGTLVDRILELQHSTNMIYDPCRLSTRFCPWVCLKAKNRVIEVWHIY